MQCNRYINAFAEQCGRMLNIVIVAYVLSTLVEHIPPRKYLMLAGVFAHFCRLVNPSQRPEMVHIFWPAGFNPIVLINDASVHIRDHRHPNRYQPVTLSFVLVSLKGDAPNFKPDGDCSQLIPAIWSLWYVLSTYPSHPLSSTCCFSTLNDGQPLQFFSASFSSLRSALNHYKEGGRLSTFKGAARPVCDTCKILLFGIGVSFEDLVSIFIVLTPSSLIHTSSRWAGCRRVQVR